MYKNPRPIVDKLKLIDKPIIFQVTLTPYKKDIEANVPSKKDVILAIKDVSKILGRENVYVRYDPIFLNEKYDVSYHIRAFDRMCSLLEGYVDKIIVSFLDDYKNVRKNMKILQVKDFTEQDYEKIGRRFSDSAKRHGMSVQTCFEERNLVEYGFIKGECLSHELAFKLTGKTYKSWAARKEKKCNCVEMVDVGAYNSCEHFCKYCYANYDEKLVHENRRKHDVNSTMIIGQVREDDVIKRRRK